MARSHVLCHRINSIINSCKYVIGKRALLPASDVQINYILGYPLGYYTNPPDPTPATTIIRENC